MPVEKTRINENHLSPDEPRWYAIRTRFRNEKAALKQLELNGINAYLPIQKLTRRYGHKVREVEMPLINSFVFVKITTAQYRIVIQTEYVAGFLKFGQNILSIPEHDVELMRRLIGENTEMTVEPSTIAYQTGDSVEVIMGPLLGLKGVLVNIQGKDKMLIDLINSGFTLQIAINKSLLRKI